MMMISTFSDLEGLWEGVTSEFEEKENGQVVDKDTESFRRPTHQI